MTQRQHQLTKGPVVAFIKVLSCLLCRSLTGSNVRETVQI